MSHYMNLIGKKAKEASLEKISTKKKNDVLKKYVSLLDSEKKSIIRANEKDIKHAIKKGFPKNLINRLTINQKKLSHIKNSINNITKLKDPIDNTLKKWTRPTGLKISKVTIPIGVIGVIYESRPNVTSDVASLCFKSGNAVILKGGSEAINSNKILAKLFRKALKINKVNKNFIQFVESKNRKMVDYMLSKMKDYIDVIIPRGGKNLVKKVKDFSNVPTIGHLEGLCHTFWDIGYDKEKAAEVVANAKLRRPEICGATETLLIHSGNSAENISHVLDNLRSQGCEIIGCTRLKEMYSIDRAATEDDWSTEYLDKKITVKIVDNIEESVEHINKYSSGHTESCLSDNQESIQYFFQNCKSAILMNNASTQFADGGEFGFGAEIGISTDKLHVRGPVGAKHLTTFKYQVTGNHTTRP